MNSLEDHTNTLAQYLPGSELFEAKNIDGSNFRDLLRGLAGAFKTAQEYISTIEAEYFPAGTTLYIDEWESAVGIPDSCFSGTGALEERQRDVIIKLASLGIQTEEDFEELAALFGVTVDVQQASPHAVFPMIFPIYFVGGAIDARFTIIVTFTVDAASRFPLTFPFIFGAAAIGILDCLFRKLKPSNCNIIFQQV